MMMAVVRKKELIVDGNCTLECELSTSARRHSAISQKAVVFIHLRTYTLC
jgi:hypothetical protein